MTLWTVEDLSRHLKVPKSWVYERTRTGEIPTVSNMGKYKRFDPDVIREWLKNSGSLKIEKRKR